MNQPRSIQVPQDSDRSRYGALLTISIELNEISDLKIQKGIESVIRDCIGDRPKTEAWSVWIRTSGGHCQVTVKGPTQTRERFFFDDTHMLPEKIRDWLASYPFR